MISRAKPVEGSLTPRTTVHRTRSRFLDVGMRLIRDKPLGLLGACIVFTLLGTAVLADVIAPYGYAETRLLHRFRALSIEHWLGTDQLGRDPAESHHLWHPSLAHRLPGGDRSRDLAGRAHRGDLGVLRGPL